MEATDEVKNMTVEVGDKQITVYDTAVTIRHMGSYSNDPLRFSREQFKKILAVMKVTLE